MGTARRAVAAAMVIGVVALGGAWAATQLPAPGPATGPSSFVAGGSAGEGASSAAPASPTVGSSTLRPSSLPGATPPSETPAPTEPHPRYRHVWWIWMENREYGAIIGNPAAPYLNTLAARFGLATRYFGITHPSEPNYIAAVAGSTLGVTTDGGYDLRARSLFDQLDEAGQSWRVYAQDVPDGCFTGASAAGGRDGPGSAGTYVRKHEPAISFLAISGDPSRCSRIGALGSFRPGAASFEFIVPNLTNDMHDGSTAQGDDFLRAFVPRITDSPAFADGVLFITWDEGTTAVGGGGRVATLVVRPGIEPGLRSATRHDHYGLLRTVEEIFGLDCLRNACRARSLAEFL